MQPTVKKMLWYARIAVALKVDLGSFFFIMSSPVTPPSSSYIYPVTRPLYTLTLVDYGN